MNHVITLLLDTHTPQNLLGATPTKNRRARHQLPRVFELPPLTSAGKDCLNVTEIERLAVCGLAATRFSVDAPLDQLVRNGVVVENVHHRSYLAEGLVEGAVVFKKGFLGTLCGILLAEGAFHELVELEPSCVLRAEMNMLKMPHPLQVLGVPVGFILQHLAPTETEKRVRVVRMSCDGESYGVGRVLGR